MTSADVTTIVVEAGGTELQALLAGSVLAEAVAVLLAPAPLGAESEPTAALRRGLAARGFAVLRVGLLSSQEMADPELATSRRFDVPVLADRTTRVVDAMRQLMPQAAKVALIGCGTAAAAAVTAATKRPSHVSAVVSLSGRPDLAVHALPRLAVPALLIVGDEDEPGIQLNEIGASRMYEQHELYLVPGAGPELNERGDGRLVAEKIAAWLCERWHRSQGSGVSAGSVAEVLTTP